MSLALQAISYLVHFEHKKGEAVKTLEQIEFVMKQVDTATRRMKTIGNTISMMGTISAPFTGGLSLFATGLGIAVNVASNLGESHRLNRLVNIAQEEIEELNRIAQNLNDICVDWNEVLITLCKAAIDGGIPYLIKEMLSESNSKVIEYIPQQFIIEIIIRLQMKCVKIVGSSIEITEITASWVVKIVIKQVSSEAGEQLGKKVIVAAFLGVCFGLAIDVIDIIRIWNSGEPEAIKKIQDVIKLLKEG